MQAAMRRTIAVLATAAAVALTTVAVGVADAAEPASGSVEGIAVAMDGTTDDGRWEALSRPLVDPDLARCYDLVTPSGGTADWSEFANRTDRVAAVSSKNCISVLRRDAGRELRLAPGESSGEFRYRSVRFTSVP
jgi:hypothetical protein